MGEYSATLYELVSLTYNSLKHIFVSCVDILLSVKAIPLCGDLMLGECILLQGIEHFKQTTIRFQFRPSREVV